MKARVLALAVVVLGFAAPAGAENSPPDDSFDVCGLTYSTAHPLSWESLEPEFPSLFEFRKAADLLLSKLLTSKNQTDPAPRDLFASKIRDVLDNKSDCCSQFIIKKDVDPEDFSPKLSLFNDAILLSACGAHNERASQMDDFRYLAHAMDHLANRKLANPRAKAAAAIRAKEDEYDQMIFHGFPMLPWEALANSLLLTDKKIANGPPANQLVLMHPSAGVEVQVGLRESQIRPSMALEPLGFVRYPPRSRHRTWWGLSTLTAFRGDMGLGVGGMARLQNFSLGILWHDSDKDGRLSNSKPFIFLGLDLYQFAGGRLRRYEGLRDEVRQALKEPAVPGK